MIETSLHGLEQLILITVGSQDFASFLGLIFYQFSRNTLWSIYFFYVSSGILHLFQCQSCAALDHLFYTPFSQDSYCQYPPVCRLLTSGMINHFSYCFVCRLYCLLPIRRKYLSGIWNKPFEIYKDLSVFHRMDVMFDMNVFEVVCTSMFYSVSILPVLVSCWCAVKYSWRKQRSIKLKVKNRQ